jgi:hypothetical protein
MNYWRIGVVTLLCTLAVAGCGNSGGYASEAKSAISTLNGAVTTYNKATPEDVQATGVSCKTASDTLKGTRVPAATSAPKQQRELAAALQHAYAEAERGFKDCAAAGARNNYMGMAQAAQEITTANQLLDRARALDH